MQKTIFHRKTDPTDSVLWQHVNAEIQRQEDHIELIASENYVSSEVLRAQGSALTNKYAEGYPGKRYYGGCEHVDEVERLAIQRAQQLFNVPYANVQPHSGSQANMAAYMALIKPGDVILGMSLAEGGHLTHGTSVNFSGKIYQSFSYGINPQSEMLDFDEIRRLAHQHKPRLIICGASAYAPAIDFVKFRAIADEVKAYLVADVAHYAGLIAAGCYPSPVGHAHVITSTTHKTLRGPRGGLILSSLEFEKDLNSAIFPQIQGGPLMHIIAAKAVAFHEAMTPAFRKYQHQVIANARVMVRVLTQDRGLRVVSGRTDCHMFLLDLRARKLTGKHAEEVLGQCHMTVNKNAVPNDPEKPFITSGIRIGTPAMTTRGFTEIESEQVAHLIADVLESPDNKDCLLRTKEKIQQMCRRFPVYPV